MILRKKSKVKKGIFLTGILFATQLLLVSCDKKVQGYDLDRENIATVCMEEAFPGKYSEDLWQELDTREMSVFLGMVPSLEYRNGITGQGFNYRMVCYDDNGNVVDEFMVDSSYNLNNKAGFNLYHNDDCKEFFKDLEAAHGISKEYIYDRAPGSEYFSKLPDVSKMNFYENTENNFIEGVDYTLKENEVEEVRELLGSAVFTGNASKDIDCLYYVSMYDEFGSSLYTVAVTKDFDVYVDGDQVEYDSVKDFIEKIEKISGYSRE
jgi:hypothetical protein